MRTRIFLLLLIASCTLSAQSTWQADKAHTNINFAISHLVISEVTGKFADFDITAKADDAFSDPSFTVTIETASIDTNVERRDNDLRSDGFFHVDTYPTISFTSTSYEKTGDQTFVLKGDLTMKGVTKPIELQGKLNGIITDQRSQKLKAGLKFTGIVNRQDFGVGGSMAPIGDEVDVVINMEMSQE